MSTQLNLMEYRKRNDSLVTLCGIHTHVLVVSRKITTIEKSKIIMLGSPNTTLDAADNAQNSFISCRQFNRRG